MKQLRRFSCAIRAAQENCCARRNPVSRGFKKGDALFWNSIYVMNVNETSMRGNVSVTSGFPLSLVNELQWYLSVCVVFFFVVVVVLQFWRVCFVRKKNNTLLFNLIYQ